MRIELQLVEFERGEYIAVPVAADECGTVLINQLMDSQFATALRPDAKPFRHPEKMAATTWPSQMVGQIEPHRYIIRRKNGAGKSPSLLVPITFASNVGFEVPIR